MKNKLLTALMCVAIATALWLYVVTVISPNSSDTYRNITLNVQGEGPLNSNGFILLTDQWPSVTLNLKGNRVDLNKINSGDITIGIDVSDINKAGTYELTLTQPSYQGIVSNHAFTVLSRSPETVTVEIDNLLSTSIPVEIVYSGAVPENYMADKENPVLDNTAINISGPKKVVDKIAMARIDVDLANKTESIDDSFTITLCDKNGEPVDAKWITASHDDVRLQLRIAQVKELPLEIEVIEGGGASKNTIALEMDTKAVEVSGSDALLEDLTSLKVGTIDLSQVKKDQIFTFPILLPEGVVNESGETEVNVDLKFLDLETKSVSITNISDVKAPEGMEVQLITKRLDVQLRGPKKRMKSISAENVTVTVDFSEEQAGKATVNAQISVNVDGVGAVGVYTVTATIKPVA